MKFKEKTKIRMIALTWLPILIFLGLIGLILCIIESIVKKDNFLNLIKILYKDFFAELVGTINSIKHGERLWK